MRAARFFFSGRRDPVIDRTCPLKDAAVAQQHMETGRPFGTIVLDVA